MRAMLKFKVRLSNAWLRLAIPLALAACSTAPPVPVVERPAPVPVEQPTAAIGPPVAPTGYIWSDGLAAAARKLRDELPQETVSVAQADDRRLWISFPSDVVFGVGRSAVQAPANSWLDRVAAALRGQPNSEVQILGDPDAASRDDVRSRTLALDRAASARDWLVIRGVPARRVSVAGRRPAAQSVAQERRLDILVGERAAPLR